MVPETGKAEALSSTPALQISSRTRYFVELQCVTKFGITHVQNTKVFIDYLLPSTGAASPLITGVNCEAVSLLGSIAKSLEAVAKKLGLSFFK